ncbi:2-hydroxyacid dehydrogenase [Smaragdicoccus niigatensis]|uniref:2-hydroxyacid dehydrogenase n=1 Tax=Smaragdicoccus niigatensis TaxID=359359 RepID=UPI000363E08E|nr:2-hydroxyacid dehydrogenase [Smaragdicoccus niigatensis]
MGREIEVTSLGASPGVRALLASRFPDSFEPSLDEGPAVRAIARSFVPLPAERLARYPRLELIANFGVGYDNIDLDYCAAHRIVVTNTPDVLTDETADTALGLLLMTVRELSAAERYLRAGNWESRPYRLTPLTLRNRRVGIVGLGRIGTAIARRVEAFGVEVGYHSRRPHPNAEWTYYGDLLGLAAASDTLIVVLPGTSETRNLISTDVFGALGPDGVVINIGRGSTVDEAALIDALRTRKISAAGLDVYPDEPRVSRELLELDNVVLLPHVGSASEYTRAQMGQLVFDNIVSWFDRGIALTPVPETPVV